MDLSILQLDNDVEGFGHFHPNRHTGKVHKGNAFKLNAYRWLVNEN